MIALGVMLLVAAGDAAVAQPVPPWSPPQALNTDAATDSAFDSEPNVTTDGAGFP